MHVPYMKRWLKGGGRGNLSDSSFLRYLALWTGLAGPTEVDAVRLNFYLSFDFNNGFKYKIGFCLPAIERNANTTVGCKPIVIYMHSAVGFNPFQRKK